MRFLVDECTGPSVANWLKSQQHDVFSVYHDARGSDDDEVLRKAAAENRILITNDKDFGEMVFRDRKKHSGVILLRLDDERAANKIEVVKRLVENYAARFPNHFVVVTENTVRIASSKFPE